MTRKIMFLLIVLLLVIPVALAQDSVSETELAETDGDGVDIVRGELAYTFGFFNNLWLDPYVLLYDGAGFVDRDFEFTPSMESQSFGRFLTDTRESPIRYEINLPAIPEGELRDVDNDDEDEMGVQFFILGIQNNLWGDPYMDERDEFYFSYPTVRVSDDAATLGEIESGKALVWAPDDEQAFPSAFGEDGFVFTEDDPVQELEQGWTMVDMSTDPFTFVRTDIVQADLLEPESAEQDDFSDMTYTEAFDAMIDLLEEEYAFTELKNIDWDEKRETFRPRVEEAEANEDPEAFRLALRDFAWSIPDGHMFGPVDNADFAEATSGGLGIAVRELDDGRVIVNYLGEGTPAAEEGIEMQAEILSINDTPIEEAIGQTQPWSLPFSTDHVLRLQQLRYVVRFPVGEEVQITYQNPGDEEPTTTTLTTVSELDSFRFSSFNAGLTGTEYPVEFEILPSGYGYVQIYSFSDDLPLTVELWDRAMRTFIGAGVPGIVIDMRQNGGGFTAVGYQMISYLFNSEAVIEINGFYDDSIGGTFIFEESPSRFSPPVEELRYDGEVVVLVSPSCSSACEYVSRALTLQNRTEVVGFYPTNGIGGGWQPFVMPEGVQMPKIVSTSYDEDLNLIIEGQGVEPTINVPVNEETLFAEDDVLLNTAIETLGEMLEFETNVVADVEVGATISGVLEEGMRDQYTVDIAQGESFVVELQPMNENVDPFLRVYVEGDEEPIAVSDNIPFEETAAARVEIVDSPADFTFVIEAATVRDAGEGAYLLTIRETTQEEEAAATEEAMMEATEEAAPAATEEAEAMEATEEAALAATEEAEAMEATEEAAPAATEEAEAMEATEEAAATEEAEAMEATEEP